MSEHYFSFIIHVHLDQIILSSPGASTIKITPHSAWWTLRAQSPWVYFHSPPPLTPHSESPPLSPHSPPPLRCCSLLEMWLPALRTTVRTCRLFACHRRRYSLRTETDILAGVLGRDNTTCSNSTASQTDSLDWRIAWNNNCTVQWRNSKW